MTRVVRRLAAAALGAALGLVCLNPLRAQHAPVPDRAYAAYQTGFYLRAMQEATARINADPADAAAMTLLGEIYRQGLGVPPDITKALDWYRIAHGKGDANASFALAMALLKGEGVAKDPARGRALLEDAAPRQPLAAFNLALLLLASGEAAERAKAIPLLENAAVAEIAEAQHALAVLKLKGELTARDVENAADLMRRAAQNGFEAAEIEYAILRFNGLGVGRDEKGAADLFERVARRGNPIAQNRLARIISAGRGRPKDPVEAAGWHLAAKMQGLEDETLDWVFDNLAPADKTRALTLGAARAPQSLTAATPQGQ